MGIRVTSTVVEIAVKDLTRSLDFYRLLGLAVPDPDGPHVEVELPGGNRLAFDKEEIIAGMHPGWTPHRRAGWRWRSGWAVRPTWTPCSRGSRAPGIPAR
jgi:hypothetical protein